MEKDGRKVIYFSFGEKKAKTVSAQHVYLSNFFICLFVEDGIEYKSVEHYFQSKKFRDPDVAERVRNAETPGQAKRLGREVKIDKDWWGSVREDVMRKAIELKFSQNLDLKEKLLHTEGSKLCEYSRRDKFWGGSCKGSANTLGSILMDVRQQLKTPNQPQAPN